MSAKSQHNSILLAVFGLVIVVLSVGLMGYLFLDEEKEDNKIEGTIEVSEFRVSCKYPGRVTYIGAEEGDFVHEGDTLAILEIPEASAQQQVAEALHEAVAATQGAIEAVGEITTTGVRKETVNSAYQLYQAALTAADLAEKTYTRAENLYNEGVMSAQKRDEALAAYNASKANAEAAKSQWELAQNSVREEEVRAAQKNNQAAEKNTQAAKGAVNVVKTLLKETVQIAQVNGEVESVFPKVGELVGLGSPIMNISLMDDMWGTFNCYEDKLHGMKVGDTFEAFVPAFNKKMKFKVFHVKDQGAFTTKTATKPGDVSLKSFEVKARPVERIEGLRPGMSVIINKEEKTKKEKSVEGFINFLMFWK